MIGVIFYTSRMSALERCHSDGNGCDAAKGSNGSLKNIQGPFGPYGSFTGAISAMRDGRLSPEARSELRAQMSMLPGFYAQVTSERDREHYIQLTREELRAITGRYIT